MIPIPVLVWLPTLFREARVSAQLCAQDTHSTSSTMPQRFMQAREEGEGAPRKFAEQNGREVIPLIIRRYFPSLL